MQLGNRSDGAAPQGDFALLREMGESGSDVFQARSTDGRDVVLRFWRSLNEIDARNAIEIANRARGVRHPMLARVFGIREHVDGTLSLVSEFVAGRTLDAWVADSGLPALRMVVDFVRRLALGLDAAVQRGVTHHAVYPGNLIVSEPDTKPQGRIVAKLVDLGVARPQQTLRFEVAHFLAPEELSARLERGRPVPVTAAMNVYSCGCLLHYLSTGQPPFQSDSLAGLTALHVAGAIAVPSQVNRDIPEHLERVIAKSLERDPKKRIPTPAALAAALSHVESVWRSSGVVRKSAVPPPPPRAAKPERVTQIPAFDLVLRPKTSSEPRSAVVAKKVEAAGRHITQEIPQLFQRPAMRPEPPVPGRATLPGGFESRTSFESGKPVPPPAPSSSRDRGETVRQRIATAREFPRVRPSAAEAEVPPAAAAAMDRVARVPELQKVSEPVVRDTEVSSLPEMEEVAETTDVLSLEGLVEALEPEESLGGAVDVAKSEAPSIDEVGASMDTDASMLAESSASVGPEASSLVAVVEPAVPAPTSAPSPSSAGAPPSPTLSAARAKLAPPRALGWPFAVPVPVARAEFARVEPAATPEPVPTPSQSETLPARTTRSFGRVPSMFGQPLAARAAVAKRGVEESARAESTSDVMAPAGSARPVSRFPSLRERIANRLAKREAEPSRAESASPPVLDPAAPPSQPSAARTIIDTQELVSAIAAQAQPTALSSEQTPVVEPSIAAPDAIASDAAAASELDAATVSDDSIEAPAPQALDASEALDSADESDESDESSEAAASKALDAASQSDSAEGPGEALEAVPPHALDASSEALDSANASVEAIDAAAPHALAASGELEPANGSAEAVDAAASNALDSAHEANAANPFATDEPGSSRVAIPVSAVDAHDPGSASAPASVSASSAFSSDSVAAPAASSFPRRRFDSTVRYGSDIAAAVATTAAPPAPEPAPENGMFFDPHESTTAVGGSVYTPRPRASTVPPPLPIWRAEDSSASIAVTPPPLNRRQRSELVTQVIPREDFVFPTVESRQRTTRRWPWVAAAGIGIGAYVSLLALNHEPAVQHSAARPTTEHTIEITRAEGQPFPLIADWKPALEPTTELPPAPVAEAPPGSRERIRAHSDESPDSSQATKPAHTNIRKADQMLDGMQVSRERAGIQARTAPSETATRETLVVNVPSSPTAAPPVVTRARVPVAPKPVVFSELWATPSVVQATDLHPKPTGNPKLVQPSIRVSSGSKSTAAARTENLEVRGSLSDQTVRRAIDRIRPQLNECFAQHGSASQTASTVRVELTIDETGRTRDAHVQGASGALDECLVQASRKLVAGAPDTGTVKVAWTLRYGR